MQQTLLNLALALAVGLIVGIERGWQERAADEGSRIAGVRTFGLIGLMGGLCEVLAGESPILFGFTYFAFALVMALAHLVEARANRDYGITTVVASLITFVLGALAVHGDRVAAAAGAVVVATLLNLKPVLHRWLEHIEGGELRAALKLLLISIVILPLLPDKGYGPWSALNPYEIWWLVVLIAAISFAAYIAVKVAGPKHGILLTALLGGMVSSTGVTVQLSRISKIARHKNLPAAGILVASAIMCVRVLLVVAIINRDLARLLWLPCLAMAVPLFGAAVVLGRNNKSVSVEAFKLRNPVEILQAVQFGAILSGILLLSKAMQEWLGQAGLYVVALASGLADVDAITVSVARNSGAGSVLAARAIVLAAMTNTLTKGLLAQGIGGKALGIRVLVPVGLALIFGGLVLWLF